jgi:IS30 family transposase
MKKYHHLTQEERYQIYALKKEGLSLEAIGKNIGRSKSTISREINRNKGKRGYRPKQAHNLAKDRELSKRKHKRLTPLHIEYINEKIELKWSPEQISGRMKLDGLTPISHETIYKYLLQDKENGGKLYLNLRHKHKRYKKRYGSGDKRGQIPNRRSIDERPKIVDDKERIGDFEIDLVIGKNHKQALITLVDRKSKFTIINKIPYKKSSLVEEAVIEMLVPLKPWIHTITSDNGKEFASHENIAKSLNIDYYFCHPYSSWERGLNENTNGLIRQFFPKGKDFSTITQKEIIDVQNNLNYRPRKSLGFKSPAEVFYGTILKLQGSA